MTTDQRRVPAGNANTRYGTPSRAGKATRDQGERSLWANHSPSPKPKNHSGASKSAKLKSAGRNCPSMLAAIPDLAIPTRIASRMPANKAIAPALRICAVAGIMRLDCHQRTVKQTVVKGPIFPPARATLEMPRLPPHLAGSDGTAA